MEPTDYIWRWMDGWRPWWRGPEAGALVCATIAGAAATAAEPEFLLRLVLLLPLLHLGLCYRVFTLPRELERLRVIPDLLVTPIDGSSFLPAFRRVYQRATLGCAAISMIWLAAAFGPHLPLSGKSLLLLVPVVWLHIAEATVVWFYFWYLLRHGLIRGVLFLPVFGIVLFLVVMFTGVLPALLIHWALPLLNLPAGVLVFRALANDLQRGFCASYMDELRMRL